MSARKSSHRTIFLIVSSGSPLALIASSLRSTSKKPFCPMTRSLHPPITACGHRVRFVGSWREEFFEVPYRLIGPDHRRREGAGNRLQAAQQIPAPDDSNLGIHLQKCVVGTSNNSWFWR